MVLQGKYEKHTATHYTRGIETSITSKEAVIEEDSKRTNLIETSMYDTMRINYIIRVSEELKWLVKEKDYFDVDTCKFRNGYFYA